MPTIATTQRLGWIAALVAGGALALAAVALAKTQKRAPPAPEPDWASHSAFAEQGAAAYFD